LGNDYFALLCALCRTVKHRKALLFCAAFAPKFIYDNFNLVFFAFYDEITA
jgi:hypothetical protein